MVNLKAIRVLSESMEVCVNTWCCVGYWILWSGHPRRPYVQTRHTRPTVCSVRFVRSRMQIKRWKRQTQRRTFKIYPGRGFYYRKAYVRPMRDQAHSPSAVSCPPFGSHPKRSEKGILFGDKNYRNCTTQVHVNADPRPLIATRLCVYFKDRIGKSTAQLVQLY